MSESILSNSKTCGLRTPNSRVGPFVRTVASRAAFVLGSAFFCGTSITACTLTEEHQSVPAHLIASNDISSNESASRGPVEQTAEHVGSALGTPPSLNEATRNEAKRDMLQRIDQRDPRVTPDRTLPGAGENKRSNVQRQAGRTSPAGASLSAPLPRAESASAAMNEADRTEHFTQHIQRVVASIAPSALPSSARVVSFERSGRNSSGEGQREGASDRPILVAFESGAVGVLSGLTKFVPLASFETPVEKAVIQGSEGFAVGWSGARVEVIDLVQGTSVAHIERFETRITSAQFQVGARAVFFGGADGRVYRWKFNESGGRAAIERYIGPGTVVSSVVTHPGGRVFFSGDWAGGLYAWLPYDQDAFGGAFDRNVFLSGPFSEKVTRQKAGRADTVPVTQMCATPDGEGLLVALQDGRVEWWMIRGLKKLGEVQAHKGFIYDASLSADGMELSTVGRDGLAKVFHLEFVDGTPPKGTFTERWHAQVRGEARIVMVGSDRVVLASEGRNSLTSFTIEAPKADADAARTQ